MYSWEIEPHIALKNYILTPKEIYNIRDSSPQVNLKYENGDWERYSTYSFWLPDMNKKVFFKMENYFYTHKEWAMVD